MVIGGKRVEKKGVNRKGSSLKKRINPKRGKYYGPDIDNR
jgi:hypothetical protein